jgi:hypothetical protein
MNKTLTFSMLAATIFGGMLITLPAEAHPWHHEWARPRCVAYYNNPYRHVPYYAYNTVPVVQHVRTGWYR